MTRSRAVLQLAGVLALIAGIAVAAATIGIPSTAELRATFGAMGWWADAGFAALYAAVTLSPLPKTVFTLAAGALFGIGNGLPVVFVGAMVGAVAAFYLARILGRDAVRRLTGSHVNRFENLLDRHGLVAVLAARLIPVVPFTAVNYAAGMTTIRPRTFFLGTAIGILPATAAYVTIGAYGNRPGAWPFWVAAGALVVLTAVGVVGGLLRRSHRRPFHRADGIDVVIEPGDADAAPPASG